MIELYIARKWNGFSMTRRYGKAVYDIEVKNPHHVSKGVKEIYLDEKKLRSNTVADLSDNKTHSVKVIMG